jgi:hypothetical protein
LREENEALKKGKKKLKYAVFDPLKLGFLARIREEDWGNL